MSNNLRLIKPIKNRMDALKRFKNFREETFKSEEELNKQKIKHIENEDEPEPTKNRRNKKTIEKIEDIVIVEKNEPMTIKEQYKFLDELDIILAEFKPRKKNKIKIKGGSIKII